MANLDFFAARSDVQRLIEYLLSETDVRIFESYSEPEKEIREFRSFDELSLAFDIGGDKHGNGSAALLQLFSPSVMNELVIERINLDPKFCDGKTFRFKVSGYALIQLYPGGVHKEVLTISHFGHNSESRAREWGYTSGVNWDAMKKLSSQIQYHIRKRLAVTKAGPCPVLPEALTLVKSGLKLKYSAGTSWEYSIQSV